MATTVEQVCNLALLRIGQRQTLDSFTGDKTEEANVCRALWDDTRDEVLSEHDWRFATRRASLALVSGVERAGWRYVYALPSDCLKVIRVTPAARTVPSKQRIPFDIEDDPVHGPILLTDQAEAEISYVYRHETVARWRPKFVQAVAWKLASELALALSVKVREGLALDQRYAMALRQAIAADLNEAQEDPVPDSEFISGRW